LSKGNLPCGWSEDSEDKDVEYPAWKSGFLKHLFCDGRVQIIPGYQGQVVGFSWAMQEHNGGAANLQQVVNFYNQRFQLGLSSEPMRDLATSCKRYSAAYR